VNLSNNQQAFLELVKAGLWEKDACLLPYGDIDFQEIYRLAQEQTVVGLVAAGLEHVTDTKPPKEVSLQFVGDALQLEQKNSAMNAFIAVLIEKMRKVDIYTLLVKGQGIAQCYERPQWRTCGDIDLFLSEDNLNNAKEFLYPISSTIGEAEEYKKHYPLEIDGWEVELHGNLRSGLWNRVDLTLDIIQNDVFCGGAVRSWMNGHTQVFLPRVDEDVVFVFSHILQHFFKEGVGLRQVCDWCRLLWTFRSSINRKLLESRIRKMRVLTEWKAFASLAVNYLGMPADSVPFYSPRLKWTRKAGRILSFIIRTGNFGHTNYAEDEPTEAGFKRKLRTLRRLTINNMMLISVFPLDSVKAWCNMFFYRLNILLKSC